MTPGLLALVILIAIAFSLAVSFLAWAFRAFKRHMGKHDWEYVEHGYLDRGRWTW